MTRRRGGRGRGGGGGNQNYYGASKSFFEYNQSTSNNNSGHIRDQSGPGGLGSRRGRGSFGGEYSGGSYSGYGGNTGGYKPNKVWTQNQNHDNEHIGLNRFARDVNNEDDEGQEGGFRKFRDPKVSQRQHVDPSKYNRPKPNYKEISKETPTNIQSTELISAAVSQPSPIRLKEPIESNEPKLQRNIKTEKIQPDCLSLASNSNKAEKLPLPDASSSNENSSEGDESQLPAKPKSNDKEKSKLVPNVKIKKEPMAANGKKRAAKQTPPAPPSPSTETSSSENSSSSSSEEEEVPKMPQPIKSTDPLTPKKERNSEDDVVCMGKPNNVQNLIDEDKSQPQLCMVCNKLGHSVNECQTKCKRCSHSSYECQVVCKNCGENYSQSVKTLPKPPNPFVMFMQFMQFCMSQYNDAHSEIKYPFPQFESASAPVLGPTPTVEVTRNDIANSKRDRKRTKSGSKHSRKRALASMNSDINSESDASSIATTSTKKRKKRAKSIAREIETPQKTQQQQQQQQLPPFGGHFPGNMPFAATFNAPGYNPMMAFSQMMGYNPVGLNFTH